MNAKDLYGFAVLSMILMAFPVHALDATQAEALHRLDSDRSGALDRYEVMFSRPSQAPGAKFLLAPLTGPSATQGTYVIGSALPEGHDEGSALQHPKLMEGRGRLR